MAGGDDGAGGCRDDGAWVELRRFAARADAEQHALVLAAAGIGCRLMPQRGAHLLLVAPVDAERARRELALYTQENRRRRRPSSPMRPLGQGLDAALAYCAILVFLHSASRRHAFAQDWWSAGLAQAGLILGGEWWRAVTALGLHADLEHLAGNVAFGSFFGLLLAQTLGPGLTWLAILLAGVAGNLLSALLHAPGHTAVGASTAVFGALGILAALAWRQQASQQRHALRRWLPLAAGIMLLAYLGVGGERTDIVAHIAGFAAGVAFGAGLAHAHHRLPQGAGAQGAYAAAALFLFALAWSLALRAAG